jgi:hypothetical protein
MLDLPGLPVLDKHALVGGCVRLPLQVDAARLAAEVNALPGNLWDGTAGRVGVQGAANAIFLRGYAPAEGARPIEDRDVLACLPYVHQIIRNMVPAEPMRCLLARLPAGAEIPPHVDRAPYFHKTLRLHIPVETNERVWMVCAGACYVMRVGEVWVLNNSTEHAVWNAHPSSSRTHLICDFLPSVALLDLVARAERDLGQHRPEIVNHLYRAGSRMARTGG